MKHIAIVTGASSGVGRSFVTYLANGAGGVLDEIWVIARSRDALIELSERYPSVCIRPIPLDLTLDSSSEKLAAMLDDGHRVEWLVNCAGLGKFGAFSTMDRQSSATMIKLNCLATIDMCSLALPYMDKGSRIINLSSIAGIIPQPYLSTYSATKAFVAEFSLMLNEELRDTGICVTAVCPKFMKTAFLNDPGNPDIARSMTRIGFQDVDEVVRKSLGAALLGRPICIPSLDMKLAAFAANLLPRSALFSIERHLFNT